MRILYGIDGTYADITGLLVRKHTTAVVIPSDDIVRVRLYKVDPCVNVVKHIVIQDDFGATMTLSNTQGMVFPLNEGKLDISAGVEDIGSICRYVVHSKGLTQAHALSYVSSMLTIPNELPGETVLPNLNTIPPDARVLQLNGNVGRLSCILATLLQNSNNLFVIAPNTETAEKLAENRDCNSLEFEIGTILPMSLEYDTIVGSSQTVLDFLSSCKIIFSRIVLHHDPSVPIHAFLIVHGFRRTCSISPCYETWER